MSKVEVKAVISWGISSRRRGTLVSPPQSLVVNTISIKARLATDYFLVEKCERLPLGNRFAIISAFYGQDMVMQKGGGGVILLYGRIPVGVLERVKEPPVTYNMSENLERTD